MFKLDLEKAEQPEVKLPTSVVSLKKQEFQKYICFYFIDYAKGFDCGSQQTGKFSSGHKTGKGQFSFQPQRKAMPNNVQTTSQLHSSHVLAK